MERQNYPLLPQCDRLGSLLESLVEQSHYPLLVFDPVFFLGLSILLVAVSLTAVLVVLVPAALELARAARSAEKLFDTLSRDLPPTLEAIRLTGMEISDLTDDVSEGVRSAGQVVRRVDQSLDVAKKQAQQVRVTTRSVFAGVKAAWRTLTYTPPVSSPNNRRSAGRLPPGHHPPLDSLKNAPEYNAYESESYDRDEYEYDQYDDQYDDQYADEPEDVYEKPLKAQNHRTSLDEKDWQAWEEEPYEGPPT